MYNSNNRLAEDVIDVISNGSLYLQIRGRERDSWHKVWLYGFTVFHIMMLFLTNFVVKFTKERRR